MNYRLLLSLLSLTLALSMPSLMRLPRIIPFLQPEVRAAAPRMLDELRSQGLWLVNTDLMEIENTADGLCFTWEYRYHGHGGIKDPRIITTCTSHAS